MQENEKLLHITSKETAIARRNRENGKINIYKWYIWKRVDNQPMKGLPQFTSYNKHTHTRHTHAAHTYTYTHHIQAIHTTHTPVIDLGRHSEKGMKTIDIDLKRG